MGMLRFGELLQRRYRTGVEQDRLRGGPAPVTTPVCTSNCGGTPTSTPTSTTPCTLSASDFKNALNGGQITVGAIVAATSTASLTVTNKTSCMAPISLSSYKVFVAPTGAGWLSTQQLIVVASTTLVASSSVTLTVPVASCMTQVDGCTGTPLRRCSTATRTDIRMFRSSSPPLSHIPVREYARFQ